MQRRLLIVAIFVLLAISTKAQRLNEYKAVNGITYRENDTVRLGKGSGVNASFLYSQLKGMGNYLTYSSHKGTDQRNIGHEYQNTFGIIKRIKKEGEKGKEKVVFNIDLGPKRADLTIDDAIEVCEVVPCENRKSLSTILVADEIMKLKKLLDSGAITQAEYDNQKKKLLGSN